MHRSSTKKIRAMWWPNDDALMNQLQRKLNNKKNLCKQTQKVSFSFLLFSLIEYLSENRLSCAIAAVQIVWTNIEHISQFRPKKAHKIESNTVANTECDRDVFWLSVCKNRRRHRVKRYIKKRGDLRDAYAMKQESMSKQKVCWTIQRTQLANDCRTGHVPLSHVVIDMKNNKNAKTRRRSKLLMLLISLPFYL